MVSDAKSMRDLFRFLHIVENPTAPLVLVLDQCLTEPVGPFLGMRVKPMVRSASFSR